MPNEYAARLFRGGARPRSGTTVRFFGESQGVGISIPGTQPLPTFRGRVLYLPLYSRTTLTSYGANVVMSARGETRLGQAEGVIGLFKIAASVAVDAAKFLGGILKEVIEVVKNILSSIITFIVDAVKKVVSSVLGAVNGLLGAVLDSVGLKGDGDLKPEKAAELAELLTAKKDTLAGHAGDLNRPMTPEEQTGYQNQINQAESGIGELAGSLVSKLGGPVGVVAIGAGIAGAILLARSAAK